MCDSMETIMWILTGVGVTAAFLNSRRRIEGFYLWLVCNAGWITIDILKEMYAQTTLFIIYSLLCIYGIYEWRKK